MLHRLSRGVAFIAPLLLACQPKSAAISDADKSALRTRNAQFAQGVMAKDWAGLAAGFSTDATFMPPNQPTVKGRDAIQSWMSNFPPVTAFKLEPQDVDGTGDFAYIHGTYAMTIAPPGAPPVEDHGKYLEVQQRQADGKWLTVQDIFNSDLPPMAPPPAAAAAHRH